MPNIEYTKQVVRSSGSVGVNYIEANESLSKKDFVFRSKRKCLLVEVNKRIKSNKLTNSDLAKELIQESTELKKSIFGYN